MVIRLLALSCLALLGTLSLWVWRESNPEHAHVLVSRAATAREMESLRREGLGVRQIVIDRLGLVDRCVTCHINVEDPAFADANLPFRFHPGLDKHPPDTFGCTLCHGGDGRATTLSAAHGEIRLWNDPMLRGEYIQAACGRCHQEQYVEGAPLLSAGRRLFDHYGCLGCHKLYSAGGKAGPDLTAVGAKHPTDLVWGNYRGERSLAIWFFRHFKDPQLLLPKSSMTDFFMSDYNAKALTVYMLSLTEERFPPEYYPRRKAGEGRGDSGPRSRRNE
ncbi:MAG: c-type cytochrome [Chloroflexi bacterium]|nr:c-type cytochrome [Chloroflexota bacterium]